jgi:hypothetical protein
MVQAEKRLGNSPSEDGGMVFFSLGHTEGVVACEPSGKTQKRRGHRRLPARGVSGFVRGDAFRTQSSLAHVRAQVRPFGAFQESSVSFLKKRVGQQNGRVEERGTAGVVLL